MEYRILGDYQLIKQIGYGSLGTVYLAEHRFMKQHYILKLLPEELVGDRGFVNRFEEEINFLSALDHPQLVRTHNVSFDQGIYFLATDCIVDDLGETTNLAQYLNGLKRSLTEEEIFHLLQQIASALDYIHTKKIGQNRLVHRGLKLNNVLIGKKQGGKLDVYLSDTGLSRIIGIEAVLTRTYKYVAELVGVDFLGSHKSNFSKYSGLPNDSQKLTSLHLSFLQNYAFLAPEQKRGDPALVDIKADIYSFGILTYFLLMNEFPEGVFEMPSEREYQCNWDNFITKCLQKHASKRPASLVESLQLVLPHKKSEIRTIPTSQVNDAISLETEEETSLKPLLQVPQLERPQFDLDPESMFQVSSAVKVYQPKPKDVSNVQPLLTDMMVIRGGTFFRGSNEGNRDEMPRHQVILSNFAIDIHPVTNEQFVRFLEVMGGEKDSQHNDIIRLKDSRIKRAAGKLTIEYGYAKHPVVGVTWYGAVAYAKWIGKRLPTEAEWEIAARGGNENAIYPTGDSIEKSQANFFSSDTTPVMSYPHNGYGLYDMAGNVYEWIQDWYSPEAYKIAMQKPENPTGPFTGRSRGLRGGSWNNGPTYCSCSARHSNNPGAGNGTYGFRCAADVQMA